MRFVVCLLPLCTFSTVETGHDPAVNVPGPDSSLWHDLHQESFPMGIFKINQHPKSLPLPHAVKVLKLGRVVGSSPTSEVYEISGFDNKWVVKYYSYCPDYSGSDERFKDDVEREEFFIKMINEKDRTLTYQHLFTSSPIVIPDGPGKLGDKPRKCSGRPAQVRYIITERLDRSIYDIMKQVGKIPIEVAARMTLQMVGLLERLHRLNIVHGDVQFGNFMIRNTQPRSMVLIDFGRSKFGPTQAQSDAHESSFYTISGHPFNSPWQIRLGLASFRDDIFRAIQTMAMMIHGKRYYQVMASIVIGRNPDSDQVFHYSDIKWVNNLFDVVMRGHNGELQREEVSFKLLDSVGVTVGNYLPIRAVLSELLAEVRSPETPMDKPNYDRVKKYLGEIIKLVHT